MNSQEKSQSQFTQDYEGSILNLLNSDNYRQYNVVIAKALGSVNAAIMLTELVQRQKYHENRDELIESPKTEGKWFYYTQDTAEDRLGLSRREQDDALKKLEVEGLIKKVILGVPGKRHFQINVNKIIEITKYSKKHSRLAETAKLDCTFPPNCFGGNVQSIYKEEIKDKEYKNHHHQSTSDSPTFPLVSKENDDDDFLFLKKFNFSSDVLHKLKKYSIAEIKKSIEVLESQVDIQNPTGFLFRALENPEKYPLPKKYEPEKQKKESEDDLLEKIQKRRDFCGDLDKKWREYNKKENIKFGDENYTHYYCNFNYVEIKTEKIFFKDMEFSSKLKDLLNKCNLPLLKKE